MIQIKIQIKSIFGSVLFEFEKENNSIKETLLEAIKSDANLSRADLSGANLSWADLSRADLSRADLSRADISGANLYGADLSGADLSGANLSRAGLSWANLSWANLSRAYLSGANLYGAGLSGANLSGADLSRADLSGANLSGADLSRADLSRADLSRAKNHELSIAKTRILPEGDIIGYKKTLEGVVKILIPKDAKRSHAFGRKCRAEYAIVLELPDSLEVCHSSYENSFEYRKGVTIKPTESFNEDWTEECSSGIHFFITKIEAEEYIL